MPREQKDELLGLFFKKKATKIFLSLNGGNPPVRYVRAISKVADTEYAHTLRVLQRFQEMGLASTIKLGRTRLYEPTEKGEEVADLIDRVIEIEEDHAEHKHV